MSQTDIPEGYRPQPARPWWRSRLFLGGVLLLLLLVGGFAGFLLYQSYAAERELRQIIAELDEAEPNGWRIHEIEAQRAVPPNDRNSALTIQTVHKRLPPNWPVRRPATIPPVNPPPEGVPFSLPQPPRPSFDERVSQLPLDLQLDEELTSELREGLERAFVALAEAQVIADQPAGRFPLNYAGGWLAMVLSSQEARTAASLLRLETALWAQDGYSDHAVRSTRGVLNCARAVGDEPTLISMLIRIAIQAIALRSLERVLAQGQPSPVELADFQRLLEDEAAQPLLWLALRGERALMHETLNDLVAGKVNAAQLGGAAGPSFVDRVEGKVLSIGAPGANARLLRLMTERIEIARRPVEEHAGRMKSLPPLRKQGGASGILVALLLPAIDKVGEAFVRSQAMLRCGITAIAAERYRQAQGRWPATLAELVEAKLLDAVPLDPFDGAPLRLRRTSEGVVVYAIGFDGKDNGGNLNDNPRISGADLGFRLWNLEWRRGPAHEWIPAPSLVADEIP